MGPYDASRPRARVGNTRPPCGAPRPVPSVLTKDDVVQGLLKLERIAVSLETLARVLENRYRTEL